MIRGFKLIIHRNIILIISISLYLAGCTRSIPVQYLTPVFPPTSTINLTPAPTVTKSNAPSSTSHDVTTEAQEEIKIIETGHLDNEILIVVFELPPELQGKDFHGTLDSTRFDCLYQENKIRLYCSGKINNSDKEIFSLLDSQDGHLIFSTTLELKEIFTDVEN